MEKLLLPKEIDDVLEGNIDELLTLMLEDAKHSRLIPIKDPIKYKAQIRDQAISEIKQCSQEFSRRFRNGMRGLLDRLSYLDHGSESVNKAIVEMQSVFSAMSPLKDNLEVVEERLNKANTIREFLGLSDETMNEFYRAAYSFHQTGKYEEAADSFYFLCAIAPWVYQFWVGYGHSEQMLDHLTASLYAYAMAVLSNHANPTPHLLAAECYHKLGNISDAINSLELAIASAQGEQHDDLKKQALQLKRTLTNQKGGKL